MFTSLPQEAILLSSRVSTSALLYVRWGRKARPSSAVPRLRVGQLALLGEASSRPGGRRAYSWRGACSSHLGRAPVLAGWLFSLQQTPGSVWRHFWLSQLGRMVLQAFSGWRPVILAKHPSMHRIAPHEGELSGIKYQQLPKLRTPGLDMRTPKQMEAVMSLMQVNTVPFLLL